MAQHDMDIANQGFPATRADLNNALQALVSNSSGATAPSTTFANQWWYDTTNNKMYLRNEANNAWIEVFTLDQTNNEWQLVTGQISAADGDGIVFKTDDGTTRVKLDDSGNLLVGKTSASTTVAGGEIRNHGGIVATRDGSWTGHFNRLTSDGDILRLQKDGTTVGNIGNQGATPFFVNGTTGGIRLGTSSGATVIHPCSETGAFENNSHDLGSGSNNWRNLYLGGGIYLGGTGAANYLDDYEEGSWTPVFAGSTAGTYTYGEQQGHYVKVGDYVTAWFNLTNITTSSAGSGTARITGLPFTANWTSGFNGDGVGSLSVNGFTGISGDHLVVIISDNTSTILLYHTTGTNNDLDTIDAQDKVNNLSDVRGCVHYYTGG